MNTVSRATALLLALLTGTAWAQVGELINAEVVERLSINDPARAEQLVDDQWFAFSIPAVEGTQTPCCWSGQRDKFRQSSCSLEQTQRSYGTRSDSPRTDNIIIYSKTGAAGTRSIRVVGEHCRMDGNGAVVTWIGDSDDGASLDWLETVSRTGGHDSIGELSLYAIALHRSDDATERLYRLAAKPGNDVAEQAVFWLGETRGERGLEKLLLLLDQASNEKNTEQMEHIVFAISMLPDDLGTDSLLELARDSKQPRKVRRQALFWLAHSDNDRAVAALADLLTRQ